tara:strand:- start:243 stop:848 length:606 start_codon:yes stop_codon:yes gene_type:complete
MGFNDANMLLSGPKQPIAKFDVVGDSITGALVDAEVAPVTSPTGEVQVDKNGNPRQQIIYTLQTDNRDTEIDDDDGKRRVFAKWAIQKAISTCLADMGLARQGLQEGGTLTITHSATQTASQRGYNDIKLFEVSYVAPPARSLPSDTSGGESAKKAVSGEYSSDAHAMAFSIRKNNPSTSLEVIATATGLSVTVLEEMFGF